MALTATANQSVVRDCMNIIKMRDPFVYTQSFNRSNLRYYIRKKTADKKLITEIADYIVGHKHETGIIYCLSKKDTEELANELGNAIPSMKNKITFYHADLNSSVKESRQRAWSKGDVKVIWYVTPCIDLFSIVCINGW